MTNKFGGECKKKETNERRYLLNADTQKTELLYTPLKQTDSSRRRTFNLVD